MNWKPASQVPTEHYDKNYAVSPEYIVLCKGRCGRNNLPIIGRTSYSFVTNRWMPCWEHIGIPNTGLEVIAWTDEPIDTL